MERKLKPTIVWDYDFQTDLVIEHGRPDIVITNTSKKQGQIIDVAISTDYNIATKRIENISNYTNLIEISLTWFSKALLGGTFKYYNG